MTLLLGILIGVCFSPPPPEVVRGALNEVLAERRYQTELPDADGKVIPPPPASGATGSGPADPGRRGRGRTGRTYGPGEARDSSDGGGFSGAGWAQALSVVLLGVVGVLALVSLARAISGRRRAVLAPLKVATGPVAPRLEDVPLEEFEALAAAGRFDEAVHLLLLRSMAAVARTVEALPISLTSREVLARARLPAGAAAELGGIVDAVETSRFGGRPVGRGGFEACRERYRRFASLCEGASA